MSTKTVVLNETVYPYFLSVSMHEHPVLKALRDETQQLNTARMQIAPEQGQFMAFLVELIGAKKTLELGTYTGYSALVVALALPDDGKVIACDVSAEWTAVGKRYWQQAKVDHKIDLRLAPGLDTLSQLIANGESGTFDFIFIDADKNNYSNYYEASLTLLRTGGLIAIDNVLWSGEVANPNNQDKDTCSIRELNERVYNDARVSMCMVPIADGLTLVRKK